MLAVLLTLKVALHIFTEGIVECHYMYSLCLALIEVVFENGVNENVKLKCEKDFWDEVKSTAKIAALLSFGSELQWPAHLNLAHLHFLSLILGYQQFNLNMTELSTTGFLRTMVVIEDSKPVARPLIQVSLYIDKPLNAYKKTKLLLLCSEYLLY